MKWEDLRRSSNVEDVRGRSIGRGAAVGGLGLGGIVLVVIFALVTGMNPGEVLNTVEQSAPPSQSQSQSSAPPVDDADSQFVSKILGDTEDVWANVFQTQLNRTYTDPKLVLFSDGVNSACGSAQTAMGPFYCPADQKVYLDMAFFQEIRATAGTNADFARAYAIAHEVGHHVQNELGIMDKVNAQQQQSDQTTANALSVRVELQADCFAGVWGHYTAQRGIINEQDIKGALDTAAQIGDDYLQKQSQGRVMPESFTHGTSQQRVDWFTRGLKSGNVNDCNTFSGSI